MAKWLPGGLIAIVLSSGCGVYAQVKVQSPIEIVITNATIMQYKQKKADDFCYV
ncbi:unnamed protein product, partial [marine sediment metagenome]